MVNELELSTSWLSGKWSDTIEIDTAHSTVAIGDFFAQGQDADEIIDAIHAIWSQTELTELESIELWANNNLSDY